MDPTPSKPKDSGPEEKKEAPGVIYSVPSLDLSQFTPAAEDKKYTAETVIRAKPLGEGRSDVVQKIQTGQHTYKNVSKDKHTVHFLNKKDKPLDFTFPKYVFDGDDDQESVFAKVMGQHLVNFLDGYNVNFFAYGQTGAGKTFTLIGPKGGFDHPVREDGAIPSTWGLFPRFMLHAFNAIKGDPSKKLTVNVSQNAFRNPQDLITKQIIQFDPILHDYAGQTEKLIESEEDIVFVCKIIETERATRGTDMNAMSSRIHCFMNLKLYQCSPEKNIRISTCRFVDLCGAERREAVFQSLDNAKNKTEMEAAFTNYSLYILQRVISAVSLLPKPVRGGKDIPNSTGWKEHGITRILKSSFNGTAFTSMIFPLSQAVSNSGESYHTMDFAKGASKLTNYITKPPVKKLSTFIEEEKKGKIEHEKALEKLRETARIDNTAIMIRKLRAKNCEEMVAFLSKFE